MPVWQLQWLLANRKAGGMEATQHVRGITRRRLKGRSKPKDVYCCEFFYFYSLSENRSKMLQLCGNRQATVYREL